MLYLGPDGAVANRELNRYSKLYSLTSYFKNLCRNTSAISAHRPMLVKESAPASELDLVIDDEGISDVAKVNGVVINPSKANQVARAYPITQFVQRYIVSAQLLEHIGNELTYILPTGNSIKDFETLFRALDNKMTQLQIRTYGLSDTTLEEIFLKVASNIHDGKDLVALCIGI